MYNLYLTLNFDFLIKVLCKVKLRTSLNDYDWSCPVRFGFRRGLRLVLCRWMHRKGLHHWIQRLKIQDLRFHRILHLISTAKNSNLTKYDVNPSRSIRKFRILFIRVLCPVFDKFRFSEINEFFGQKEKKFDLFWKIFEFDKLYLVWLFAIKRISRKYIIWEHRRKEICSEFTKYCFYTNANLIKKLAQLK